MAEAEARVVRPPTLDGRPAAPTGVRPAREDTAVVATAGAVVPPPVGAAGTPAARQAPEPVARRGARPRVAHAAGPGLKGDEEAGVLVQELHERPEVNGRTAVPVLPTQEAPVHVPRLAVPLVNGVARVPVAHDQAGRPYLPVVRAPVADIVASAGPRKGRMAAGATSGAGVVGRGGSVLAIRVVPRRNSERAHYR